MPRRLIDLSHEIEAGMTTYPGLPGPFIGDHLSRDGSRGHYAEGTTFRSCRIELIATRHLPRRAVSSFRRGP